jgi:hypothetical protein
MLLIQIPEQKNKFTTKQNQIPPEVKILSQITPTWYHEPPSAAAPAQYRTSQQTTRNVTFSCPIYIKVPYTHYRTKKKKQEIRIWPDQ